MEIGSQSVQKLYGDALKASQPSSLEQQNGFGEGQGQSFMETIGEAAQETLDAIVAGEEVAKAAMAGKADPHSVVEALAATEMALEMAVTVRDKVVEAYQEILRMPV